MPSSARLTRRGRSREYFIRILLLFLHLFSAQNASSVAALPLVQPPPPWMLPRPIHPENPDRHDHLNSHTINSNHKKQTSARRARLGLLEKKSDYRARAADFHKKEATLKSLARKAEARNPDEFYFGMHNARTEKGVAVVE